MSNRKLDIGVVSYRNPEKLKKTLESIERRSTTDWRCFIIHNPADGDLATRVVIEEAIRRNSRFEPVMMSENVGYAGGVCALMRRFTTEYVVYCDNDVEIMTNGWDERLCFYLDRFHEIGLIFPNGGAYQIPRDSYTEVMWGVGFCWATTRVVVSDTGMFDTTLGHQEEADYCLRVRMAGRRCAAAMDVQVAHHATSTNDPTSIERISRGVMAWVDKWNHYFNGKNFNYHSPNVTRWEDWPPNALYLEEYWKMKLPGLNDAPETTMIDGRAYDLIKVPRFKDFYRGRII